MPNWSGVPVIPRSDVSGSCAILHIYPSLLQAAAGRGDAGCLERVILGHRGVVMQDLGYELPRISIPRTPVNKIKEKRKGWVPPRPGYG